MHRPGWRTTPTGAAMGAAHSRPPPPVAGCRGWLESFDSGPRRAANRPVAGNSLRDQPMNAALTLLLILFLATTASADTFGTGANQFTIDFVTIHHAGNFADSTVRFPRPAG